MNIMIEPISIEQKSVCFPMMILMNMDTLDIHESMIIGMRKDDIPSLSEWMENWQDSCWSGLAANIMICVILIT